MLILSEANIAILAVPKTGSTALEAALRHDADIVFSRGRKHITAQRYRNRIAPFIEQTFGEKLETVAVMREPLAQLKSWFCYRSQPRHAHTARSTQEMTFSQFVRGVLQDKPPSYAKVGSQFRFLTDRKGTLLVTHLFSYDAQPKLLDFLSHRMGYDVSLARENVSPLRQTKLQKRLDQKLRAVRAQDFALYDQLTASHGYIGPGWAPGRDIVDLASPMAIKRRHGPPLKTTGGRTSSPLKTDQDPMSALIKKAI